MRRVTALAICIASLAALGSASGKPPPGTAKVGMSLKVLLCVGNDPTNCGPVPKGARGVLAGGSKDGWYPSPSVKQAGTITADGGEIECPGKCTATTTQRAQVTLRAASAEDRGYGTYTFFGWSGGSCDGSHNRVCKIALSQKTTEIHAIFSFSS
jgi:hypothetical protein